MHLQTDMGLQTPKGLSALETWLTVDGRPMTRVPIYGLSGMEVSGWSDFLHAG